MSLGRVLYAFPESRAARILPRYKSSKLFSSCWRKAVSGHATPDRIDVELDRSVAEGDVLSAALPLFSRIRPW